ncbi:hypothetical protein ACJRO7_015736 [Eucalyptus globulus]|uniref:Legumain prodomain domain-containing protein n=1 Tax=Eucalyptus globulus TaxID=34317 RepID=A0ABD3L4W8_EUCGL
MISSAAMIRLSSAAMILLAGATLLVLLYVTAGRNVAGVVIGLPSDPSRLFRSGDDDSVGTRWAVLIAGSKGYGNYRHQVKKRTANDNTAYGSHVMRLGDIGLSKENLFLYMGTNSPFVDDNSLRPPQKDFDQQDANLLYFWLEFFEAPEGSSRKLEAQKQFFEALSHRMHIDHSVKLIGKLLFGIKKGPEVLKAVRPVGQPFVDDWACLKSLVRTFETHCGSLSEYGLKYVRSFANMCNAGIQTEQMTEVSGEACARNPYGPWSSLSRGFSA